MATRRNLSIWAVALGVIMLIGIFTGLGLAGSFDSDGRSPKSGQSPDVKPAPGPTDSPRAARNAAIGPTDTPPPAINPKAEPTDKLAPIIDPEAEPNDTFPPTVDLEPEATEAPTPTTGPHTPEKLEPEAGVGAALIPDPDFEKGLSLAGISTRGWRTDFSLHSVPYGDILSGGPPKDGIPAINDPVFTTFEDADGWLGTEEPVIAFERNGDARAYPLQILTCHEIVNDVVGGVPVTVTFCPLCNSAIVFDSRLEAVVHDFGTSGKLRNSDLVMYDRQTESWWQQFTGEAIVGELTGKRLTFLPASIISWEDFKAAFPDGKVLSKDTGFSRPYGQNPYGGYDRADNPPFLLLGESDGRLLPKERVAAVTIGDVDAAFPFSVLEDERVVNYTVNGRDLVVFFALGTRSALDGRSIKDSRDVGATGVFDPNPDGQRLTFSADSDRFVDNETGSVWNIVGQATEGPLAGKALTPIVHANHFWFAWGAFKPDTKIYRATD